MILVNNEQAKTWDLSNTVLVFDHIPKCGGVTLNTLMAALLPQDAIQTYKFLPHFAAPVRSGTRYVTGHLAWGIHNFIADKDVLYFTFVRDPLRLALSLYKYLHNTRAIELCCEEYLTQHYPHNYMVRHLGNGSLAKAECKLFTTYACFGIVEHYTESLQHLFGILANGFFQPERPQRLPLKKANVSRQKSEPLSQEIIDYFRRLNADDYALYDLALQTFRREPVPDAVRFYESADTAYTEISAAAIDCSKQKRYADLIELAQEKPDETIHRKDFEVAIDAALKMGDLRKAGEIAERSERLYPLYLFERYLQIYEQRSDYAHCLEYLRQYALFPLAIKSSGTDSFAECLFNKVSLLQNYYAILLENKDNAYQELKARAYALDYDALSRPDYAALVSIVTTLGLDEVIGVIYDNLLTRKPAPGYQELVTPIALYYYNNNQPQKASAAFRILRTYDPLQFTTLQALLVMQRDRAAQEEAVADLERLRSLLPDRYYGYRVLKQLFAHTYQQGGIALDSLEQRYDSEFSGNLLSHAVGAKHAYVPFGSVALPEPLLVIASGPKVIFDVLYAGLLSGGRRVDVLGGSHLQPYFNELALNGTLCVFPGRQFVFGRDYQRLASSLPPGAYGSSIFFMSRYDTRDYKDIIALAETVTREMIYCYVYDQIFSDAFRNGLFVYSELDVTRRNGE